MSEQNNRNSKGIDVDIGLVAIPAGSFMMGCSPGDDECRDSERPPHPVRITKPFEMAKYETTQAQWEAAMGNNPSEFKGVNRPVESVSWNDVQEFLRKVNEKNDGYRYRLPTEAEWEYAARAGSTGPRYGKLDEIAWYEENSGNETHEVGQKSPNAWGLYDMLGNVCEWVADWYDARPMLVVTASAYEFFRIPESYYGHSPETDPMGPTMGRYKGMRGGSYGSLSRALRVSYRYFNSTVSRSHTIGFRCVREVIP